jgi:hypothetical protein
MKTMNQINSKSKTLGLLLAALVPTGAALADGGYHHGHRDRGIEAVGSVVVTKEIPGGVITVGATIGNPRPVVVEERKVVVVKREERCEPRKVVVVREAPVVHKKVVIVEKHGRHDRHVKKIVTVERDRHGHGHRRGHDRDWDRHDRRDRDRDGHRHGGHSHGRQVSIDKQGPDGSYHYYEDDRMVSIDDNRGGQTRHVYVKK